MVIFHSYVNVYQRVAISTWTDISGWWITTVQFSPKNDIPIPIHIVWNRSKISFRSPQFANGYWVISFRPQIQWIFSIWTIQYLVPNAVTLSGATGRRPLHKLRKLFIWLGWMKGGWGIHSQWGIHPTQTWELKCKRPNNGGNHWQNDNRIESTKSFGVLGSSQQISGMNTTFCLKRGKDLLKCGSSNMDLTRNDGLKIHTVPWAQNLFCSLGNPHVKPSLDDLLWS